MRISTKSMFEAGVTQMSSLQTALARSQQQLSTDRRMLTPADDPIASARALEVTQSQSINTQLVTNRQNARNFLSQEDQALQGTHNLIQDVQSLVVYAGNGSLRDVDREALATELEGRMNDLLGLANTADGAGGYLFSGFMSTTQPFNQTAGGASYMGDSGQRQLQVGPSRFVPVSDNGNRVFESNMTGNGAFVTGADPGDPAVNDIGNFARGSQGIISGGSVTDASLLTKDDYSINISVVPNAATGRSDTFFTVTSKSGKPVTTTATSGDPPAPVDLSTPQPYVSGQAINFDGMTLDIKGELKDGDVFTTKPSTQESLFTTLRDLLTVIRSPGEGPAGQAALNNGLNAAHRTLDTAFDNVVAVRADVGTRMRELDLLDDAGADRNIQYASTLSDLQDLDFIATTSMFAQQQTTLQAAQKSFNGLANLSLFNYIS